MAWTDERVETLKRLWAAGFPASHIASRLGGVTRNGVIGKVHRLGLGGRTSAARRSQGGGPRNHNHRDRGRNPRDSASETVSSQDAHDSPAALPDSPAPEPAGATRPEATDRSTQGPASSACDDSGLLPAGPGQCKWPIGDPRGGQYSICPRTAVAGKPYCAAHCRVAYQPARPPRWRRPSHSRRGRGGAMGGAWV